jgi:hypothetical protein
MWEMRCSSMLDTGGTDALVDALTCHVVSMTRGGRHNVRKRDAGARQLTCPAHGRIFDINRISNVGTRMIGLHAACRTNPPHHAIAMSNRPSRAQGRCMRSCDSKSRAAPLALEYCFASVFRCQQMPRCPGGGSKQGGQVFLVTALPTHLNTAAMPSHPGH